MTNGRYARYPDHRDTDSEWLGQVPVHWTVSKFAYLKTVLTDFTANGSFASLKERVQYRDEPSYARLVRLTDLRCDLRNEDGVWIDESAYNYLSKSALFGGEFLLANVGAYAGLFYQMPPDKGNCSLAPNMFMAKFDARKVAGSFMALVGQGKSASAQLFLRARASSAQPKLNKDDFKSVVFAYPPLEEQTQIAKFLDYETAKIDALIEKQKQLIELLKEKRQAVISHAVTKGLNPDAPMRDSGVEWLGKVPAHWEVMQFRRLTHLQQGLQIAQELRFHEPAPDRAEYITMRSINSGTDTGPKEYIAAATKRVICNTDDVLLGRTGATGDVVTNVCGVFHNNFFKVNFDRKLLLRDYLVHYLGVRQVKSHLLMLAGTTTIPDLNHGAFLGTRICLPPLSEQSELCAYLSLQNKKYEKLENAAVGAVAILQERRTALISAAVTGKIDVRGWKRPASASDAIPEVA